MKPFALLLLSALLLTGTFGMGASPGWAQDIISKIAANGEGYCHLRFAAIREETLNWDRPVLKDASAGDIIDFYGPCNYDPVGKEEVRRQKILRNEQLRVHTGE